MERMSTGPEISRLHTIEELLVFPWGNSMLQQKLNFKGSKKVYSIKYSELCHPANSVQGFPRIPISAHPQQHWLSFFFFNFSNSHPNRCEMISRCGFDLQ